MSSRAGSSIKYRVVFVLIALAAVLTDQASKSWALSNLSENRVEPFIGSFISLQLVHNSGAAFSLLENATWIFTVLAAVILGVIVYYALRTASWLWIVSLSVLFGGAVGNFIDRLIRPPAFGMGHVVDFLNWNGWFVGNVADIYIVVAAIALFFLALTGVPRNKQHVEGKHE